MSEMEDFGFHIGQVHLNVSHLDRASYFFEEGLGFKVLAKEESTVDLGTVAGECLLVLHRVNNPVPRKSTTGLYHVAIRLPQREDLARMIYHLVNNQVELSGIADHGVSEALYLTGPEEIGIELYYDRPEEDWPLDEEGNMEMVTEELDLDDLMMTLQGKTKQWQGLPAGTAIGHVHLRVAELEKTAEFYTKIGFDITQEYGEQALFFSSGGYHHHIGANIWQSAGAPPLPADTAGLRYFEICVDDQESYDQVKEQLAQEELSFKEVEDILQLVDPNGIQLEIKRCK